MYRRIMLTHDGSELADTAIAHAATLAAATQSPVLAVQVIDTVAHVLAQTSSISIEPAAAGAMSAEIAEQAVAAQQEAATKNLARIAADLAAQGVTTIETRVLQGSPGDAICEAAKEEGCDLIVIASRGRSGIKRALLGSVADHVARNTPHSAVLLIRPVKED